MLKHVAPIDPAASIPDPDHRDFLPPKGRDVPWTPYWAGLSARDEIVVSEAGAPPVIAPEAPPADEAPPAGEPHADA